MLTATAAALALTFAACSRSAVLDVSYLTPDPLPEAHVPAASAAAPEGIPNRSDPASVRFVAFAEAADGGVDRVQGARIAVVNLHELHEYYYKQASPEWVSTNADGFAETIVPFSLREPGSESVAYCVMAPGRDDEIAKCIYSSLRLRSQVFPDNRESIVYVYFSDGHDYFQLDETRSRFDHINSRASTDEGTATVWITYYYDGSIGDGDDVYRTWLSPGRFVSVIADYDIGLWLDWISDPSTIIRPTYQQVSSAPGLFMSTGPFGSVEVDLEPGGYLFCEIEVSGTWYLQWEGREPATTSRGLIGDPTVVAGPDPDPDDRARIGDCVHAHVGAGLPNTIMFWGINRGEGPGGDSGVENSTHFLTTSTPQRPYQEALREAWTQERDRFCALALLTDDEFEAVVQSIDDYPLLLSKSDYYYDSWTTSDPDKWGELRERWWPHSRALCAELLN